MSTPVADSGARVVPGKDGPSAGSGAGTSASSGAGPTPEPLSLDHDRQAQAQAQVVRQHQMQKRIAVAAQALTNASDVAIPSVPKTAVSRQLIESAIADNLLFQGLSLGARQAIVSSMAPQVVSPGEEIIKQGDPDATTYYVVERGEFDVLLSKEEWGGEERKVHTCGSGRCACNEKSRCQTPAAALAVLCLLVSRAWTTPDACLSMMLLTACAVNPRQRLW